VARIAVRRASGVGWAEEGGRRDQLSFREGTVPGTQREQVFCSIGLRFEGCGIYIYQAADERASVVGCRRKAKGGREESSSTN